MADGDGRKALIPSLAEELTGPLTEFLERGSTGGCRGGYPWRLASGYALRYTGEQRPAPAAAGGSCTRSGDTGEAAA